MIIKTKAVSVQIEKEAIDKLINWRSTLEHSLTRATTVYETDTYIVRAYYSTSNETVFIYSKSKGSPTEVSNFIGVATPKEFKPGGYYVLPLTFSEETVIWAQGSSIIFTDYRKCIETLKRIIGLKINVGFGGEDFPI